HERLEQQPELHGPADAAGHVLDEARPDLFHLEPHFVPAPGPRARVIRAGKTETGSPPGAAGTVCSSCRAACAGRDRPCNFFFFGAGTRSTFTAMVSVLVKTTTSPTFTFFRF